MSRDKSQNPLEEEILAEKAASLFRVTARMEASLEALRSLDRELASTPSPPPAKRQARARLLEEAAEWVWYFVVQRETLGLANPDSVFELYEIPHEVRQRMGPRRGRSS